jgi:hypothetical protein
VTRDSPATFSDPQGDYREGEEEVFSTYEHDAKLSRPAATVTSKSFR